MITVVIALLFFGVALTVFTLISRGSQQILARKIAQKYSQDDVLAVTTKANFEGIESEGYTQFRGRCAVVLLSDTVVFMRAYPFKEYAIETTAMTQVLHTSTFLSKKYLRPIVVIKFVENESLNAIGFSLEHQKEWEKAIDGLI